MKKKKERRYMTRRIEGACMRFTDEITYALDQKYGEGNWKIRHSINWAKSLEASKKKKLDPKKSWSVSVLKDGQWSIPEHAVDTLNELSEVEI